LCVALLLCTANITSAQSNPRAITGTYHNPAEGFSVRVPRGFKGIAGDQAGPERGVKILLGEGRRIVVFGEPNSLEWKDTAQAIRSAVEAGGPVTNNVEVTSARLGSLAASRAVLQSGSRALEVVVAFRPGGGPIYRARLESDRKHFRPDQAVFKKVIRSFRIEAWK
jgi:hypothetical protein